MFSIYKHKFLGPKKILAINSQIVLISLKVLSCNINKRFMLEDLNAKMRMKYVIEF